MELLTAVRHTFLEIRICVDQSIISPDRLQLLERRVCSLINRFYAPWSRQVSFLAVPLYFCSPFSIPPFMSLFVLIAIFIFRLEGMCFPGEIHLSAEWVPLAQLLLSMGYCVRFLERRSSRFIDLHCISGVTEYHNLWSEAESSFYETAEENKSQQSEDSYAPQRQQHFDY